jgi:hypothetical protein
MRRIEVACTVDIEQTADSLHAHVVPEGIDVGPGDRVLVHGAPSRIAFGESVTLRCSATVIRATAIGRLWARFASLAEFTALYEVGFERKESP